MPRENANYAHVTRALGELRPFAKNARHHSDAQVAKLARSIKEFGFTAPLIIDDTNAVLAGYGRLMAAREIPIAAVPCIVVTGLTATQKRALMLADNKIATESSWSQDLLVETLGEISADGFDLTLTGFDTFEIDALLTPMPMFEDDDAEVAEKASRVPSITVTVPSAINVPSVAAILRRAIHMSGFKGVRVKEPKH